MFYESITHAGICVSDISFIVLCFLRYGLKMVGRIVGLNLTGRKMRTWLGSGTIHLENGMEILMIKVPSTSCLCKLYL